MRIATFNLLHGLALSSGRPDSSTDAALLREAVAGLDADVLGLQEVDVHQPRSAMVHQVAEAAGAMGAASWRFAPSVHGTPGVERTWVPASDADAHGGDDAFDVDHGPRYGVGLVSRLPVRDWRVTRFDAAPWSLPLLVPSDTGGRRPQVLRIPDEPRAAVAGVVDGRHGPVTVATVHLSFVPGYNVRQLRAVRGWLAGLPRPLLLVGDLNLPGAIPRRASGWTQLARVPTYPSYRPKVQFDHVLADGLPAEVAARASTTARAVTLGISDHCALVVDVDV